MLRITQKAVLTSCMLLFFFYKILIAKNDFADSASKITPRPSKTALATRFDGHQS